MEIRSTEWFVLWKYMRQRSEKRLEAAQVLRQHLLFLIQVQIQEEEESATYVKSRVIRWINASLILSHRHSRVT